MGFKFSHIKKNQTNNFVAVFLNGNAPYRVEKHILHNQASLEMFIKNKNNDSHNEFVKALSEFKKYKEVGCESCKRSCVQCPKLPDFDKMVFNSEGYKQEWVLVKRKIQISCGICDKCDTCKACPCSFIGEFNQDNSARLCGWFVEEIEPRKILENMEKGMNKIESVLAITNGTYPEGV